MPSDDTADNIKQGDDIEILNPEWHIATLGEGGKLVMELTFDKGRGYVPAERNKQAIIEKNDINTLPVDSIYTPVLKVNYNVESTRVGQAIDYDKLTIEVWTDGTINAQEAVSLAARVLTEHLNLFVNLSDEAAGAEIMVEKTNDDKEKALEMTIEELDLSVRSFNCLKRAGINTVEDLVSKSEYSHTVSRREAQHGAFHAAAALAAVDYQRYPAVHVVHDMLGSGGAGASRQVRGRRRERESAGVDYRPCRRAFRHSDCNGVQSAAGSRRYHVRLRKNHRQRPRPVLLSYFQCQLRYLANQRRELLQRADMHYQRVVLGASLGLEYASDCGFVARVCG